MKNEVILGQALGRINKLTSSTIIPDQRTNSYSFLELFTPIKKGNYALTDEAIYASLQEEGELLPVWGGNQEHDNPDRFIPEFGRTKKGKRIGVFADEGVILSLDGSAGSMTYKENGKFTLNHHAGFFRIKEDAENRVFLPFFALFCQHQLKRVVVSDGSKTLTLDRLYSMNFDLPSIASQKSIMLKIRSINQKKKVIENILSKINRTLEKTVL